MPGTRYRQGWEDAAAMAAFMCSISPDNTKQHNKLKHNLIVAITNDITPRQREVIMLYFADHLKQCEIGERLGIDKSTVSRTIARGKRKIRKLLKYGAAELLYEANRQEGLIDE